jgi:hypothetical protein
MFKVGDRVRVKCSFEGVWNIIFVFSFDEMYTVENVTHKWGITLLKLHGVDGNFATLYFEHMSDDFILE